METQFIELCINGDLIRAQQLLQLNPDINISAGYCEVWWTCNDEAAFRSACAKCHLHVAQWLLQVSKERGQDINISAENEHAFRMACYNGNLNVCQWLLQVKPTINISAENDDAFRWACQNGHLHVAQWLLQVSKERGQDINISVFNDEVFGWACYNGHLHICQWLLEVCPSINISACNEQAFRWACIYRHLNVAKWLQSLKPYLYVLEYDENGKYKGYRIREKEEANWEKRKYLVYISSDCKEDNLLYRLPCDLSKMVIGFV